MRRVAAITWRRQAGAVAGGAQWRPIQVGPSALRSPPIAAPPSLSRPVCSSSSSSLYPSAFFRPLSTAAKPHLRFSTTATPAMHSTQKLTPASIQSSSPPKPFPPTSPPSRSSPTASPTASSTSPLAGSASPPTPPSSLSSHTSAATSVDPLAPPDPSLESTEAPVEDDRESTFLRWERIKQIWLNSLLAIVSIMLILTLTRAVIRIMHVPGPQGQKQSSGAAANKAE